MIKELADDIVSVSLITDVVIVKKNNLFLVLIMERWSWYSVDGAWSSYTLFST